MAEINNKYFFSFDEDKRSILWNLDDFSVISDIFQSLHENVLDYIFFEDEFEIILLGKH